MQNNEPTDADLVFRVIAGDREAFGCLYDRYAPLVRAVLCVAAIDRSSIQDLTQECFLRAYQNVARLRQPDRFGSWMVGIARHIARERRRTVRRDRHRFVGRGSPEVPSERNPAGAAESAEETERVMRRLVELPERERLAVHAFYLQGCDAKQAAGLLGLSRSGLYALLERAIGRLAALARRQEAKKEAE